MDIERVPWDDVLPEFLELWEQGQHICLLGLTGSGKTTLGLHLLDQAAAQSGAHVFALGVKARDKTLVDTGWPIIDEWPPSWEEREGGRLVVWPPYTRPSTARRHTAERVAQVLDEVMLEGGWRFLIDEMQYIVQTLGLRSILDEYWNGARSSGISVIGASQRPTWVSRSGVTQVEWLITFNINDVDDRARAAEICGSRKLFMPAIESLRKPRHEFLMVHTITGRAVITRLPPSRRVEAPPEPPRSPWRRFVESVTGV